MEMGRADAAQCSYPQKARNRTFSSFLTEVFILQTILLMRQKPKLCHVGISSAPPPQGWILIQTIGLAPTHRKVSSTWFSASFLSCCGLCGPRFNPGWLLLRHPLFYSVSSCSPDHSLVCPWGWECCSGDQVSHWDMEIPTRLCKPVSLSFPSGHSLSRHLGKCRGSTDRALLWNPPHFCLNISPPFLPSPEGLSGLQGEAQFFWNPLALLVVVFPAILWMPRTLFVRAFKTQKPERNIFFLCFAFSRTHFRNLWLGWLGGNNT